MALLEINDIGLSFAGIKAIDGVSLDVPAGSITAIIGPNGAGKTSLFNCISSVYRPQRGSIVFDGNEMTRVAPHRVAGMGIARIFQNLALFEHMTVLENLLIGCHHDFGGNWLLDMLWSRKTRREEVRQRTKAELVIDLLDLEQVRKMPVGVLPYGVLKRVELGRALCMEPKLLLLDEPAAGLNQEETEDMARYILDIKEEMGVTQLLIEHELRFVMELADKIAVLDFGRKIAEGEPAEIRNNRSVIDAYVGTGGGDQ